MNVLKIISIDHLIQLINEGYEIEGKQFHFENNSSNTTLTLVKNGTKIIADANNIDEYVLHLLPLYDPNKKGIRMIWIPDTKIYWKFEIAFVNLILNLVENNAIPLIFSNQLSSSSIYYELVKWISREKNKKFGTKKLSAIFSSVCIVNKKNGKVSSETYEKELLDLQQIHILLERSKKLDYSISVSFILLNQDLTKPSNFDALIGIIVYDLKNRRTLAINFQCFTSFIRQFEYDTSRGMFDIVKKLFDDTINSDLKLKSFLPLPLDSPLFTITPWIIYSNLSTIKQYNEDKKNYAITIPEFFSFGYSEFSPGTKTFDYHYFSKNKRGHATCILNFNGYDDKRIKYIMRFDQSLGEPLVHIDFSFYDGPETKLISHYPLDLEEVYNFSPELFIGMMSAGLFDANFTTLFDNGLKGLQNLIKKNHAFSYPLILIWRIGTWIKWLNENRKGYEILKKLFYLTPLDEDDKKFINKMMKETQLGDFTLIKKNKNNEISLNFNGYMVLIRFLRNQNNLSVTI